MTLVSVFARPKFPVRDGPDRGHAADSQKPTRMTRSGPIDRCRRCPLSGVKLTSSAPKKELRLLGGRLSNVAVAPVALRWQQPFRSSRGRPGIAIAKSQLRNLDHGDCHWAVAKWSIGIGVVQCWLLPGDPMPAFLSGPGPDAHASPLKLPPLKFFFVPRPRRRVCALLSR
jgi:hypothetical protein